MTVTLYQIVNDAHQHDNGFVPIYDCGLFRAPLAKADSTFERDAMSPDLFSLRLESAVKINPKGFGVMVGTPSQIELAAKRAQFLYLPGEVCRQADVLEAASKTGMTVFLERGAFLSPRDLLLALPKLEKCRVVLVDGGSAFGYGDRVFDPRAFAVYAETHCEVAVNLSDLLRPTGQPYTYEPDWLHHEKFVAAFLTVCRAFQVQHLIVNRGSSVSTVAAQSLLTMFTGA